jgi:YD repeat-containing protein
VQLQISGAGLIDELRLGPVNARIKTYTYTIGYGPASVADENGKITYYEYDTLGRLKLVRDHDNNIVNHYKYHYAGSQ